MRTVASCLVYLVRILASPSLVELLIILSISPRRPLVCQASSSLPASNSRRGTQPSLGRRCNLPLPARAGFPSAPPSPPLIFASMGLPQILLVAAALFVCAADGYILFIEGRECLTLHIESGDSITGSFVVLDVDSAWSEDVGGVDFWIEGPNNYKMYSVRNKADDSYQIRAVHSGEHKFCLENVEHMAASVDLNFHIGHHVPVKLHEIAKDDHFDDIYQQLINIENDVWDIIQTQEHFKARDLRRKKTNESTSRRVIWYTVLEALVFVGACAAQLYVLRRLFERKAAKFSA